MYVYSLVAFKITNIFRQTKAKNLNRKEQTKQSTKRKHLQSIMITYVAFLFGKYFILIHFLAFIQITFRPDERESREMASNPFAYLVYPSK